MILLFVDETGDAKLKDYFGLCCAKINSTFYRQIKTDTQRILTEGGWDPKVEFKGSFLFSASKGDPQITIERRIEMADKILALNKSQKNARIEFAYLKNKKSENPRNDYLRYLPELLKRALPRSSNRKGGKAVAILHCDYRSDIKASDIHNAVADMIREQGYALFEDVVMAPSNFHTVGILYADIFGYLFCRHDILKNDSDLFELSPNQLATDGRIKKLKTSTNLLGLVKKFKSYEVKPSASAPANP